MQELKLFSVTMTEEELSLFSEFLEQKEFNSKAQKARRRKFDLEQGLSSKANEYFRPHTSNPLEAIKLSEAERLRAHNTSIQQGNRVGIKKTSDLLDKATKNTKTDFFNGDTLTLTNPSEIREITNAQNLIKAGRQRSRVGKINTHFEVNSDNGQSLNRLINRRGSGDVTSDISNIMGKRNSRKALQEVQSVKPKKVVEQVKTEVQSVKPKKVVEQVKTEVQSVKPKKVNPALKGKVADLKKISKLKKTGKTAVAIAIPVAAIGTGVAVYKKYNKKNKDKKKEENN